MKVEISNQGELLHVYKLRRTGRGLNPEPRPLCSIYEDDFFDLLSIKEFIQATEKSQIRFDVNERELILKSKTVFR